MNEGNGPAPARDGTRRRRGFNMFGSNVDDHPERDPTSPRPASIASSEFPRPSAESAPFGWPAMETGLAKNSPLAANWSLNVTQPWSRNPSRRPSIQHGGSSGALSTGLATEEDEFLPIENLSPPPVGVIGTRPSSSHKPVTPKLNPAAPTFKAMFIRTSKADKGKGKAQDTDSADEAASKPSDDYSPAPPRKSRDTYSIRTDDSSMADSHESLDQTVSNTPSEVKENSFQKLLRKGSSSKFSLSSIRGNSKKTT